MSIIIEEFAILIAHTYIPFYMKIDCIF